MGTTFKVGDVVYLKSGAPAMTITDFWSHTNNFTVYWFLEDLKLQYDMFPSDCLTLTSPGA